MIYERGVFPFVVIGSKIFGMALLTHKAGCFEKLTLSARFPKTGVFRERGGTPSVARAQERFDVMGLMRVRNRCKS